MAVITEGLKTLDNPLGKMLEKSESSFLNELRELVGARNIFKLEQEVLPDRHGEAEYLIVRMLIGSSRPSRCIEYTYGFKRDDFWKDVDVHLYDVERIYQFAGLGGGVDAIRH
ncbi:hypothetical protein [Paenibacillus whitsoniae]|uniref:Uncharacterized protein n=1 Tax=Paenibacillus whitsoniae TaxID=2496558 RepID=A0A3S0C680_9BACL|nr:hypothetical protein [Paenibacillus whitsoniae]RTE05512.1 hypothetical protein EJQ19_25160 [Paenibacillus whitsoniae]